MAKTHKTAEDLFPLFDEAVMKALGKARRPKPSQETHDKWIDDNDVTWWVHRWNPDCTELGCAIHAPTDHHMKDWPKVMSMGTLVVRICEHDYEHPDPDSFAYFASRGQYHMGVHNCDGCCMIHLKPRSGETVVVREMQ